MARKVKVKKVNPATNAEIRAIAVTGRFSKGASGFAALSNTPAIVPMIKSGYLETVFQKLCIFTTLIETKNRWLDSFKLSSF